MGAFITQYRCSTVVFPSLAAAPARNTIYPLLWFMVHINNECISERQATVEGCKVLGCVFICIIFSFPDRRIWIKLRMFKVKRSLRRRLLFKKNDWWKLFNPVRSAQHLKINHTSKSLSELFLLVLAPWDICHQKKKSFRFTFITDLFVWLCFQSEYYISCFTTLWTLNTFNHCT